MASKTKTQKTENRSSRTERRLKQRMMNPVRAQAMHEARLKDDFATAPHQAKKKTKLPSHKPEIYIGCSGWFYWDWKGKFYPEEMPTSQWFDHYRHHFDTVELNAPFYSWPTLANVRSWVRQTKNETFHYTVKVSELITHEKKFIGTKTLVKDFGLIADILGEHMGCFLFQLPPSYKYSETRLKNILSQLNPACRNVVEFRHPSWWNNNVYKQFEKAGTIFCSCSAPKLPDELIKTSDEIYIRFHGVKKWYRYDYSEEELRIWAKRIHESKAKQVWIYFNNDFDIYAIKNADQLNRMLQI